MGSRVTAVVALGANVGDRASHLEFAVDRLREVLVDLRISSFFETQPVDVDEPQGPFLNAAAVGQAIGHPRALLEALLAIERLRGRERPYPRAPRTLDLDLILFGDAIVDEPGLVVPHPRFRERRFVLEPLVELAPALRDPVTGRSIRALLDDLAARAPGSPASRR
jgi:2-amino-4-hydroxy-6-hydroxymethyldihydropteridine diphosphokinase